VFSFIEKHYFLIKTVLITAIISNLLLSSFSIYLIYDQSYLIEERKAVSRFFVVNAAVHLFPIFIILYKKILGAIQRFFCELGYSGNLAIFRIVFFWYLFSKDNSSLIELIKIPKDLHHASWQLPQWFLEYLPINEVWVSTSVFLFKVFCFLSCIGLLTHFSSLMALILGFYIMGVPHYLGKLNHHHHEFWFLAILAMSRSADSLSLDRLISTWRNKTQNHFLEHSPSIVYSLPLRFIWILMGILYFFPGFWKIWGGGLDWIMSNHLKYYMYFKWMSYDIAPPFPIDQHPVLLKILAALVILFEMSFILLIFSTRWRYLAVMSGLIFHKMTQLFLGIHFYSLVLCYIAFFDWQRIWYLVDRNLLRSNSWLSWNDSKNLIPSVTVLKSGRPYPLILCGLFLVAGNVYYGFRNYHSWPFSCYPTFMEMRNNPYSYVLTMDVFDRNHRKIEYNTKNSFYSPDYLQEFLVTLSHERNNKEKVGKRLRGFFESWKEKDEQLKAGVYIEFYVDTLDMTPGQQGKVIERKKIHKLSL
jgi:hypothetical protein